MFHPLLRKGLNANLRTFLVTRQGKRRRLSLRKNVTFFSQIGRLSRRAALEKKKLAQELKFIKDPYFLSDQAYILVILPTHEISTLTKFHCNRPKIVDFLVRG